VDRRGHRAGGDLWGAARLGSLAGMSGRHVHPNRSAFWPGRSAALPAPAVTAVTALTALMATALLATALLATACTGSDDGSAAPVGGDTTLAPLVTPAPATTVPVTAPPTSAVPTTTSTTTTSTTIPPETTTTFPFVNQGAVVIVANAANVPGAATKFTEALAEYGFTLLEPTDGAGPEEIIEVTRIYARPESQAVADSVARVMGGIAVERMPTPAPITGATDGLGEATILVMLGRDLAGGPLPGPPPA
jgi:LytR cell envelope-related transcriptional attenuator